MSKIGSDAPLVSAVIPAFNAERYLSQTVESVLAQTYTNIECLVINDGSIDLTGEIAKGFGGRIRYISKPNGGVSSARNMGIRESKGDFVAFLDADDKWLPKKIERQVAALSSSDAVICLTGLTFIDGAGQIIGKDSVPDKDGVVRNILSLDRETGFIATTGLLRREVFYSIGDFDEKLSTSADADLVLRIATTYDFVNIPEQLAMYRHHTGQMHHNLEALEHDANITLEKFFDHPAIPDRYASMQQMAISSLESTLAIGHLSRGAYVQGFKHGVKALRYAPIIVMKKAAAVVQAKLR